MNSLLIAAEAGAKNGTIIPHDINEVIWGSISFLLVVALVAWKGRPAIVAMWNGRIERIRNEVSSAAETRAAAEAKLAEVESSISNADTERQRIVSEARNDAQAVKAQIIARAQADAAELRARGVADAQSTRAQASSDLQAEIGSLALGAAERVVVSSLDSSMQSQLIDDYINSVGAGS